MKKKEQIYKVKNAIIQKSLDDFRQLFTTSLKDSHIDDKEYHRFVNMYQKYREATRVVSQSQNITNKRDATLTSHMSSHKPSHKPYSFYNYFIPF